MSEIRFCEFYQNDIDFSDALKSCLKEMEMQEAQQNSLSFSLAAKVKDYMQLVKFTLSFTVVFSCVVCYLLVPVISFNLLSVLLLFAGGMLITGSANAINQVVEKDTDAMMKRTSGRPVASGRMSVAEGWTFALVAGVLGVAIMAWRFNMLSAGLGLLSLFLYAFVYTPLKKVNSISVLVGAIPGAMPCLIGWVAGSDTLSPFEKVPGSDVYNLAGWALFGLQFLWQFPHFFAIAWVAHKDYLKAGFKLLPSVEGPTAFTALQSVAYALLMVPVGVLPYWLGISGRISLIIVFLANLFMIIQCLRLYKNRDVASARRVMFSSYIYLPVVLLALLADKAQPHFT